MQVLCCAGFPQAQRQNVIQRDIPPRIVFLDRDTLRPEAVLRPPAFPHVLEVHANTRPDEVALRITDADIVITNKVRIDAASIATAKRLRLIAVAATGYEIIDIAACRSHNVAVTNIRGYAGVTVPEHVFASALHLACMSNLPAAKAKQMPVKGVCRLRRCWPPVM
jgi:lactate dehydrogenase-like 2-hydroxyacid dehydrogenase